MPVAQDHLAAIRKAVGAVLRRHGFRVRSKREWTRGDDDSGWVVVAWRGDGVLTHLPAWLPYAAWLDLPEPEETLVPARRRWWRR